MKFFARLKQLFDSGRIDLNERFEIVRESVSGTMSAFHQARDRATGKVVGLKLLDQEKMAAFEARFKGLNKPSEGEIGQAIHHPLVAETLEHGVARNGQPYIVMEYVQGIGLHTLIQDRAPVLAGKRLHLIKLMVEAVGAVHKAGFMHRDICPRNFIVAPDASTLKLIDFGLTLPMKKEYMLPGNRTGTPLYMAPEIVRRKNTDHRVDIFSLGVTAYLLCSFQHPWPVNEVSGKAALQHDTAEPTPILSVVPDLNPELAKLIMACLAARAEQRPESCDAMLRVLRNLQSGTRL